MGIILNKFIFLLKGFLLKDISAKPLSYIERSQQASAFLNCFFVYKACICPVFFDKLAALKKSNACIRTS